MNGKLKRILAIVGLVFMGIFTVSFVIVLINPSLLHGAFGYLSLISVLLGVGFFIIVKFVLKDKEPPEYLPEDGDGEESKDENKEEEKPKESEEHND